MLNEMKLPTLLLMIISKRRKSFIIRIFALEIKFTLITVIMIHSDDSGGECFK